ncbi:hypothetical protein FACS189443_0650 [Planctomycetales bacterium]|nr:hypothetical protein FACS189443_0650 [Planctomycetales bacterium]
MNALDGGTNRPFFSEVELAILQDLGHNSIVLDNHFGHSYYQDNTTDTNTEGFNSNATYGVGLHLVAGGNTIIQNADLTASGYAGAGIRIENNDNKVTVAQGRTIQANGEEGIGVLAMWEDITKPINRGTMLINRGTIEATHATGTGVWFNANATKFDNTGTINALNNEAIYIANGVTVGTINIMDGSAIFGDIVNDGNLSTLTFGKAADGNGEATGNADAGFWLNYAGNITGAGTFDLQTLGGYTWLSGLTLDRFRDVAVGNNSILDLDGLGTVAISGDATIGQNATLTGFDNERSFTANTGTITNDGNVQNFLNLRANAIENNGTGTIQNNTNVQSNTGLQNSGRILNTGTITVGGLLFNNKIIDTAQLVDVTGNIINVGANARIENITTLRSLTNSLNNTNGARLTNNQTIDVGNDLTNDAGSMIANNQNITVGNDLTNGAGSSIANSQNITVRNDLFNGGVIDTAQLVDVTGNIINDGAAARIENITTLRSLTNSLNNTNGARLTNNQTIDVGNDLTNDAGSMIANNQNITVGNDLTNGAGSSIANSQNITVRNDLFNGGLINTAQLVDVTGNIINDGAAAWIGNITTLRSRTNLNNTNGAQLTNNQTIDVWNDLTNGAGSLIANNQNIIVGNDLTNDTGSLIVNNRNITVENDLFNGGVIDTFDNLVVVRDASNWWNGYINVKTGSQMTVGNDAFNAGYVRANGNVIAANQFINQAAGYVDGIGTITTTNGFFNTGTIAPGNSIGTLTIAGPFFNTAPGAFNIEIAHTKEYYPGKPVKGVHNDLVDVIDNVPGDGIATINGGFVNVAAPTNDKLLNPIDPARYVGNTKYIFLDTADPGDLIVNTNLVAADPPNILLFDLIADHDTKSYWLDVQREYYYGPFGDTFNQQAVGFYVDETGLDPNPLGDYFNVLVALDNLNAGIPHRTGISSAAKYALDQMSGAIYGTAATASIQNTSVVNNTLADVLRRGSLGTYFVSDEGEFIKTVNRWNLWGLGFGNGGTTQFDGNAYGYRQSFGGTVIGVDSYSFNGMYRLGAFASYGQGRISSDLIEKSKSDEFLAGLYFQKDCNNGYLMMNGGLGNYRYDTERTISFMGRKTENEHDAFLGTVYLERGFEFGGAFANFQPFFGTQYVGMRQDEFTESGADSLNLVADATDSHSLRSVLGGRVNFNTAGRLSFFGNAVWQHEFLRPYTNFTAQFSNPNHVNFSSDTKFTVRGNDPGRDWVILGGGLNYSRNQLRLFAGYDLYMNERQSLHTGNAGFVYGW